MFAYHIAFSNLHGFKAAEPPTSLLFTSNIFGVSSRLWYTVDGSNFREGSTASLSFITYL